MIAFRLFFCSAFSRVRVRVCSIGAGIALSLIHICAWPTAGALPRHAGFDWREEASAQALSSKSRWHRTNDHNSQPGGTSLMFSQS